MEFSCHAFGHTPNLDDTCATRCFCLVQTLDLSGRLAIDGSVDLGAACVSKAGKASIVELRNPKTLNALDETTLAPLETAIDLAILDSSTEVAVLRRRACRTSKICWPANIFSRYQSTHLYRRDLIRILLSTCDGYENKMLRGVARNGASLMTSAIHH